MITAKLVKRPDMDKILKNVRFGTAMGLTRTAKEGQEAVQGAVRSSFTFRNNWLAPSNKFGIRIKPAKRDDLSAEVKTQATWLKKQGKGGNVTASSRVRQFRYTYNGQEFIARPSKELRPPGSTKVLVKRLWPSALKNPFVTKTKKGVYLLCQRYGPGPRDIVVMYILDPVVTIKPVDAFYKPIQKVVDRRLNTNIRTGIDRALATMR